jgi:hypothetical protein
LNGVRKRLPELSIACLGLFVTISLVLDFMFVVYRSFIILAYFIYTIVLKPFLKILDGTSNQTFI